MRWFIVLALVALIASSCRSDSIALVYRFDPGVQTTYTLDAEASATWNIGGPGGGSYTVRFEVVETVEEADENGAIVSVEMTPVNVQERGLPSPGAERREFSLRIGPSGQVEEVLEIDGVAAAALDPDELVFIGIYRPPLSEDPVRLGDTWRSENQLRLEGVFQQVLTDGNLDRLDHDAGGRVGEIDYAGEGPLAWTTTLPQGKADLTGAAETSSRAIFDIDGGFLREANATTHGTFDVRVVPGGDRAPIMGTLELDLDLRVSRTGP